MIRLGYQPDDLVVLLIPGSAYTAGLKNKSGDWPSGASIRLVFTHEGAAVATWTADLDGDLATWSENSAAVQAVLDSPAVRTAELWYSTATSDPVQWARGTAQVVS